MKDLQKIITAALTAGILLCLCSCGKPAEQTQITVQTEPSAEVTTVQTTATEALAPIIQQREPEVFDEPAINAENAANFRDLLADLVYAYEYPSENDDETIQEDLDAIQQISELDHELACSIVDNWRSVFLDADYPLYYYQGEDNAPELEGSGIQNSSSHAIVILGYELSNGLMQDELIGRLNAAASLADAYPETLIVCSGGVTGVNNTQGNTEAGLMRDYLIDECGIDPSRIFVDERALTTADNATNTFAMLRANDVHSITIVTSSYHMRWGQAVYNVVASLYQSRIDYHIESVANYCYDTEPSLYYYSRGDRFAAHQIGEILSLPEQYLQELPSVFN